MERDEALAEAWEWFKKFNDKAPSATQYSFSTGPKVTAPTEVWALVRMIADWLLNISALEQAVFKQYEKEV